MAVNYDFVGWATRNDLRCSDGRTIRRDALEIAMAKEYLWFGIISMTTYRTFLDSLI